MHRCGVLLVVLVGAAASAVLLGQGYVGYDASWALVWGSEIAAGTLPSYESALAPTPHPLANLVAVPLTLLPNHGDGALIALSFVAFSALLAGIATLATRLARWPAGVVAALVLGTRPLLGREAGFASVDIPFLALVVWAAAIEARRPRSGWPVLGMLALAGLLRPEAWLLSIAYTAWLARDRSRRGPGIVLLAVAAPLLWALSDAIVTGDPLHSLTSTRELAVELDRPSGLATAAVGIPRSLSEILGPTVLAAGILGVCTCLLAADRRWALPVSAGGLGVLVFLAIGAAQLPVLERYLLVPASALALMAGVGVAAWLVGDGGQRTLLAAAAVSIGLLLVAAAPPTIDGITSARELTRERSRVTEALRAATSSSAFRAAASNCPVVRIPSFRARPALLLDRTADPRRLSVGNLADGEPGLVLTYRTQATAIVFDLGAPSEARLQAAPAGSRIVSRNRHWIAYANC